jgi:hypothetical protein
LHIALQTLFSEIRPMKSHILLAVAVCFLFPFSCINQAQKDEQLAQKYCGSCHVFPDPGLLDKNTWEKSVLPQMSFRMGIETSLLSSISPDDQLEVLRTIPGEPLVTPEQWESIRTYYLKNSPDSLGARTATISNIVEQFTPEPYTSIPEALTTFIKSDTGHNSIYVGSRLNKLYRLNEKFMLEDSFLLASPPSFIRFSIDGDPILSLMGIMDPNDQPKGEIIALHEADHTKHQLIDSLKRPVYFEIVDLDQDGLEDMVVCAFGNYAGALIAFKNLGNGKFEKHTLQYLPGARKVIIRDIDNNGMADILALMSQGDEKIITLLNQGNFKFRINTILRFPPVYGSSYFDVADFNSDGKFDILYTNGDNADYSMILKPYHGVRIFFNNGNNDFIESWFYNMHGASQAIARDFDLDGDLDIAAISFFPDFKKHAEQGFIYFENNGTEYVPQITAMAATGRWLNLEAADIDQDGDVDILLGALNFYNGVPSELAQRWKDKNISIIVMRNKEH